MESDKGAHDLWCQLLEPGRPLPPATVTRRLCIPTPGLCIPTPRLCIPTTTGGTRVSEVSDRLCTSMAGAALRVIAHVPGAGCWWGLSVSSPACMCVGCVVHSLANSKLVSRGAVQ